MNYKDYGISGECQGVYSRKTRVGVQEVLNLAMDAALSTSPNIAVPATLTSFVDTEVSNVLFDPRNATEIFGEVKMGDWTTSTAIFKVAETTGYIAPYGDYSPDGKSDVNYNFPRREQALFQTIIGYGDLETSLASEAKLNLIADKQLAAAKTIAIASNYFYLYGVSGKEIYGLLNDPNLNPAITAANTGTGSSTKWEKKDTKQIYEDILALFAELVEQNKNISTNNKIVLVLPPSRNVALGKATDFNMSVQDMLNKYFVGGLDIIVLPELENSTGDASIYMCVREIEGETVGVCAFGEKYRLGRVVPELSSFSQKAMFSTYGAVIKQPSCIAAMTGV